MSNNQTTFSASTVEDEDLRSDVEDELAWDPAVPSAGIAASVTDHTVVLAGTVHQLTQRLAAVRAARRVKGVHAIVDEIVVSPPEGCGASDPELGIAVERSLEQSASVPSTVKATVRNGIITLTGDVDYKFQKNAADRAVRDIRGVKWVANNISVKARTSEKVVRSKIVAAMHRNAALNAEHIRVATSGNEVWLSGTTPSLAARTQAELAAWSTPGVEAVHNDIVVA